MTTIDEYVPGATSAPPKTAALLVSTSPLPSAGRMESWKRTVPHVTWMPFTAPNCHTGSLGLTE